MLPAFGDSAVFRLEAEDAGDSQSASMADDGMIRVA